MRQVLLVAPTGAMDPLTELVAAWREAGVAVSIEPYVKTLPDVAARVRDSDGIDAALLVGSARRAPATALPAPFVTDRAARRVPLAWLPATSPAALRRFAATAARVHRRGGGEPALALLGQWHPRYLRLVDRIVELVHRHVRPYRWTADVITREGLVGALGSGLGLGLYLGHGRPVGWVGYHGLRGHHFDAFHGEPSGALLSLCCRTASRRRTTLSYAESLPLLGVTAASFGATSDTLHTDNTRWALGMCDALAAGVSTVGDLIVRAAPASPAAVAPYRLIGDPLAPLTSARGALTRANGVPTYP